MRVTGWDCFIRIERLLEGRRQWVEAEAHSLLSHPKNAGSVHETAAKAAKKMAQRTNPRAIASVLASMGHPHRLIILHRLLQGRATYQQLQATTNLKAGPLYHHVATLRLAALIGPKARDTYELTELGCRLAVVSVLIPKLARAKRKRGS